jgi:hypothetical protein
VDQKENHEHSCINRENQPVLFASRHISGIQTTPFAWLGMADRHWSFGAAHHDGIDAGAGQVSLVPLVLTIGIQAAVCLGAFALAFWFPTMCYELDRESLTLRYGPILTYHIPFDQIKTIRRCNLGLTLWSSIRFPGIALFTVPTGDAGDVKMCATAAMKGILLIETPKGTYGITPADEAEFVDAIRSRIKE